MKTLFSPTFFFISNGLVEILTTYTFEALLSHEKIVRK